MPHVSSPPVLRPLGVGEILGTALARLPAARVLRCGGSWPSSSRFPAALNGALAVAERQVRDSGGSSGSLVDPAVARAGREPRRVLPRDRRDVPARRGRLPRAHGRPRRVAALRPASACPSVIWVSLIVGVGVGIGTLLLVVPGVYLFVAWSVAVPGAAEREPARHGGAAPLARARARPLVVVRRRARAGVPDGDHRGGGDPRRADRDLRLGRQRQRALLRAGRREPDRQHARPAVLGRPPPPCSTSISACARRSSARRR